MISALLALVLLIVFCVRWPAAAVASCFLLFAFAWRLVAAAYLDAGGPVFAEELNGLVGGPGAGSAFGIAIALAVTGFAWVFRPAAFAGRLVQPPLRVGQKAVTLGDAMFWIAALFVLALYADMARRGVVPLFAHMERYEYATKHAGGLHLWLFTYGQLLAMQMGSLLVYPRLLGQPPDWRFLGLFVAIMAYCLLTGHRFSAFYSFGAFFLMPVAAVLLLRERGRLPAQAPDGTMIGRWLGRKSTWLALGVIGLLVIGGALAHSFFVVRDYGDQATEKFIQRLLIQPVQLWWLTWERVAGLGDWRPEAAANFMFEDPLEPGRNTGIQWLMLRALGPDRAGQLLSQGQQYAGGFPEVFFELFGVGWAWVAMVPVSLVCAWLLRAWLIALIAGRFVTSFLAAYVFYTLSIVYGGGMLNFLVAWTFWIKVAAFVAALWLERSLQRERLALAPWILWWRPDGALSGSNQFKSSMEKQFI